MTQNFKKVTGVFLILVCVLIGYVDSSSRNIRSRQPTIHHSKVYRKRLPLFKPVNDKNRITLALEREMKSRGIAVNASRFNHGYQLIPKTERIVSHLVRNLKTSDYDNFVKQEILPLIKRVSTRYQTKIFFRSSGSNNNLIAVVNRGLVTYDLLAQDLSKQILGSLRASGFRCMVTRIGAERYRIQLRTILKKGLNQKWTEALNSAKSIDPSVILKVSASSK